MGCGKCSRQKPPRTHHCSVCKRCVLKMDHHCPWVNNCVGHGNYRYFCLFLLYLFLCCVFVATTCFQQFFDAVFHPRKSIHPRQDRECVALCYIMACSVSIALVLLGGFHVYLALTNQTTLEFQSNWSQRLISRQRGEMFRNPYDMGR